MNRDEWKQQHQEKRIGLAQGYQRFEGFCERNGVRAKVSDYAGIVGVNPVTVKKGLEELGAK